MQQLCITWSILTVNVSFLEIDKYALMGFISEFLRKLFPGITIAPLVFVTDRWEHGNRNYAEVLCKLMCRF